MEKLHYQSPAIHIVRISYRQAILNDSGSSQSGPSANWMSDPGVKEKEDE